MSEQDTQVPQNEPQYTEVEQQAIEQGWRPKDQYEGDPTKWRDAQSFLDRGELFTKIDSMGKELRETKKALKMLQEHHSKVKETEFKRAVDELKNLQKQHLEAGNSDEYLKTTELLTDLKAEQKAREVLKEKEPQEQATETHPSFDAWVSRNNWYKNDTEMREFADTVGLRHAQANPGKSPEEVLKYVEGQIKRAYPEKFTNPNRNKPSAVEGTSSSPTSTKKDDGLELTDDERRVMNTFIRQGVMTKDDYIKELKKIRG